MRACGMRSAIQRGCAIQFPIEKIPDSQKLTLAFSVYSESGTRNKKGMRIIRGPARIFFACETESPFSTGACATERILGYFAVAAGTIVAS
jgi:hypothetical protein